MINNVTLIGNLGQDPELKKLESGAQVARMSLATNKNWQNKEGEWKTETQWHNVILWRGLAERAAQTLKKGYMVYIEGEIQYRKYQDENDKTCYRTDIVVSRFRKLTKTESGNDNSFPNELPAHIEGVASTELEPAASGADDDLPF